MNAFPRLSDSEIQELASKIPSGNKWPQSFYLEILLSKNSPFSSHDSLADRLAAHFGNKSIKSNERSALIGLIPALLQHFRSNGVINDAVYDLEYERLKSILSSKSP